MTHRFTLLATSTVFLGLAALAQQVDSAEDVDVVEPEIAPTVDARPIDQPLVQDHLLTGVNTTSPGNADELYDFDAPSAELELADDEMEEAEVLELDEKEMIDPEPTTDASALETEPSGY